MNIRPSADFPGAEHQPLAYPGTRPDYSFIYYQDMVYEITAQKDTDVTFVPADAARQVKDMLWFSRIDAFLAERGNAPLSERHAVLAVGSNGCPGRLAEKYAGRPEVALPVFTGRMVNTVVVYSSRFAPYGALPATYMYHPGAVSKLSVVMLTDEQLELMDETEAVGEFYFRIPVPGFFRVNDGLLIGDLFAYMDSRILCYRDRPVRLKTFAGDDNLDWPVMSEPEVLSLAFDQAGLLKGRTVEERHRQWLADEKLRQRLDTGITNLMCSQSLNKQGQIVNKERPSVKFSRVIRTDKRPGSEGTFIVRLTRARSRQLRMKNGQYARVRYGNSSVTACLSIDDELADDETIRMDQTLRTAIGLEPMMQRPDREELVYRPYGAGDLKFPINVQKSEFKGPGLLTRTLKQQYLVCTVHNAMVWDMENPIVRMAEWAMQSLGLEPGDQVCLINENHHLSMRCLPLDTKHQLPLRIMEEDFAAWKYPLPENEDLRLPWITIDRQTRLALDVQPWEPILVGRDTGHLLASEYGHIALAIALGALGGAIVVDFLLFQLISLLVGLTVISLLIWAKIRSRI